MIDKEICAVVVTYNRKELLIRCINQILLQTRVPDILIFDNYSSDGTKDYLIQKKFYKKVMLDILRQTEIWEVRVVFR